MTTKTKQQELTKAERIVLASFKPRERWVGIMDRACDLNNAAYVLTTLMSNTYPEGNEERDGAVSWVSWLAKDAADQLKSELEAWEEMELIKAKQGRQEAAAGRVS